MRRALLGSLMGALLSAALPAAVAAQASFDSVAAHLKPGQHVRVHASGGPRLEGRLAAVTTPPSILQITVGDTVQSVGAADSLWVRSSATVPGMVAGGAGLGLAGAVIFQGVCNSEGSGPGSVCNAGVLTIASVGAGVLLGAAIGSGIHSWHLRYPSPPAGVGLVPLPGARLGIAVLLRSPARVR